MTPEQLDAIENRQAAAMWIGGPTAAFAQDTLALIKALREAQDAVKEWQNHAKEQQEAFAFWFRAANDTAKERDEARAEVERLKALLENKP